MITAITRFELPEPVSRDEAQRIFLTTAPTYQNVPGLVRKCYILSPDGHSVGGIYLWNTRAEAEAMYNEEWREFVRGKYNCEPSVDYYETPVVVDNPTNSIITDE